MLARVRSNLNLGDLWYAAHTGSSQPCEVIERTVAERYGFPHALLFPSGRSALRALLGALGWREREILCPAYICAEVPYAVTLTGNRVKFVDSACDHFLPGPSEWRAAATHRSAMAIITPLFGYPVDRECEASIRRASPSAFILYDEAQSYGATDAAGLQAADADGVLLSLGLGKMATALSGGMVLLRDGALVRAARAFRETHFTLPHLSRAAGLVARGAAACLAFREPALSVVDWIGRNVGVFPTEASDWLPSAQPEPQTEGETLPSNYQARIGLRQLARLDAVIASRRGISQYYEDRLRREGFRTFAAASQPTWPRYPLAVEGREATTAEMRKHGIQVSLFLPYSCAKLSAYQPEARCCSNADLWGRSMINLPNWQGLGSEQAKRVVDSLLRIRDRIPEIVAWPNR